MCVEAIRLRNFLLQTVYVAEVIGTDKQSGGN